MKSQKTSVWIRPEKKKIGEAEAYCSNCGREVVYQIIDNRYQFENFCPHCGAKMNGKDDEEFEEGIK